jgi:hypothetical protein
VSLATAVRQDTIELDFLSACADLAQAKRARQAKDTPAARARLQECAARVDTILDRSNDLARDRG